MVEFIAPLPEDVNVFEFDTMSELDGSISDAL
jgi:hypothetical protein